MRSLKYLPALLPLQFLNAAGRPDADTTVVVTSTRTITICPITELFTCEADVLPTTTTKNTQPTSVSVTTTQSGGGSGSSSSSHSGGVSSTTVSGGSGSSSSSHGGSISSTTVSGGGSGSSSSSHSGSASSTTVSSGGNGSGTTTSDSGSPATTTTSGSGGNGTTTSHSGVTTTTSPGSGVNGTTTSHSGITTTTSPGSGVNGTTTTSGSSTLTTTSSGFGGNATTTTSFSSNATTTTSFAGNATTTTSFAGNATTTTSFAGNATTTTSFAGNATTTSHSGNITTSFTSTTTAGNATTTSFTSLTTTTANSTTNSTTTTTTTTQCQNSTQTATGIPEPSCNDASDRSVWCSGKSTSDDTHTTFRTGETKTYNLVIAEGTVNFDGTGAKSVFTINGKTPGEPIVANWGDEVSVTVTNLLTHNATTIHWHGIRQFGTNDQDGVPGVTECAIAPGQSRTYTWHAATYGTGWYHSHTLAQYGGGIRGPIIIHGPATENYDLDMGTVMIDETFSQTIFQMAYNIARVRGALPPSTNYMLNGKNKSPDGSTGEASKWVVKKGKKHLFRIINSSAQTAFAVHFDNHKMKVIGADFTPIVPYETDTLWLASGQRYNVVVEMNQPVGSYYLRAVTQTGCGIQCANNGLGNSNGIFSYEGSCPQPTASNFTLTTTGICKDEPLASLVPFVTKNGGSSESFQATAKVLPGGNAAGQTFAGYGSVNRWFLGGVSDLSSNTGTLVGSKTINVTFDQPTLKTLATVPDLAYNSSIYSNAVVLDGVAGDWVYFVIQNNFQTSHPMHLHGHDFSVLGQGSGVFTAGMVGQLNFNNPIRRDTVLLTGFGTPTAFTSGWTVIGFQTDNPGAWVMHCHIMWHSDGGMGLQYLERPAEIDAGKYYNTATFQNECAAYSSYEAAGGEVKAPYEAGIKRHIEDHKFHGYAYGHAAVRHSF